MNWEKSIFQLKSSLSWLTIMESLWIIWSEDQRTKIKDHLFSERAVILFFISSFQFYPVKSFSERSIHARFPPLIFSSVEVTPGNTNVCLNIGLPIPEKLIFLHEKIGVTGFEPATSTSRT